jgi:hypothetical protein
LAPGFALLRALPQRVGAVIAAYTRFARARAPGFGEAPVKREAPAKAR